MTDLYQRAAQKNRSLLGHMPAKSGEQMRMTCPLVDRPDCGEHGIGPCPYMEHCEKPETLEESARRWQRAIDCADTT